MGFSHLEWELLRMDAELAARLGLKKYFDLTDFKSDAQKRRARTYGAHCLIVFRLPLGGSRQCDTDSPVCSVAR